ncbi:GNAT family N-acetyltransferase [Xenorhabdus sp. KJ12.1]|uniref:GNAT family N-acetyltransferase n=1 Tax=Xenorhabdus sp. KJ12.1 TaxID=1851571 RepID=UPI000C04ABAE|nr:GNAT family N-acetyltransferase [Xenorhabdus sp. KJ12.1]PHM70852.1 GNAT family acetyltransferase [Xenorhabdus sp. KJ12.1]
MLKIQQAVTEDTLLLSQMLEESYRFHFSYLWKDKDELEEYIAEESSPESIANSLNTPNHKWFIAETNRPIGFIKIVVNKTIPDSELTGLYLHKLYLLPHLTGQNYGQKMFGHVEKLGQEQGQKWLWLEVLESNKQAKKFYEKNEMKWYRDIIFTSTKQQSTLHIMIKEISR